LVAALQREPEWVSEVSKPSVKTTLSSRASTSSRLQFFERRGRKQSFDFLADICGADRGVEEEPRFEVNYHLFSTTKYHRCV
jgi:NADH:ubiquinone oxidoreductase subunit C